MADDEMIDPEDELVEPAEEEAEEVDAEIDPDDLDEEALEADEEFGAIDDEFAETADPEEDEAEEDTDGPVRRAVPAADDYDDDDILAPDDVEADLDTILKDRLVTTEESDDEDEEPEDRSEAADRLQPKRSDERLCPSCFLLIRNGAPFCPIGDDDCPLIPSGR